MAQQRALPQSKETLLQSYNKRLKDDVKSIMDNFTEIIKTAKVRRAGGSRRSETREGGGLRVWPAVRSVAGPRRSGVTGWGSALRAQVLRGRGRPGAENAQARPLSARGEYWGGQQRSGE